MPVYLRKNWIETHNYMEKLEQEQNKNTISDERINDYI